MLSSLRKVKKKTKRHCLSRKQFPDSKHRKLLGKPVDISSRFLESITFHTRDSVTVFETFVVNCKESMPQVSGVGCCLGAKFNLMHERRPGLTNTQSEQFEI